MYSERLNKPLPGVPINSLSASLDNVRWSKDGIIAVGGSENVVLLVPKFIQGFKVKDDTPWDTVNLLINIFTDEEVPLMFPLSWKSFSIGQEQSEAQCASLAWSPSGIAKHGRSSLAVLTANHVLAIWECVGKPEVSSDWVRVCIVNHALREFAASQYPESDEGATEKQVTAQRIRSFAWSPVPVLSHADTAMNPSSMLGISYLAVSNDAGDVIILDVTSPHDLLSPENQQWTCSVVKSYAARPVPSRKAPLMACIPGASRNRKVFVDQVSWSPWSLDSTGAVSSILATTMQSSLECKTIRLDVFNTASPLALGPSLPRIVDENVAIPAGPMRWMAKPTAEGEMYLVYPCRKILYCLVFHPKKASGIRVTKQALENAWDEVSGLAFIEDHNGRPAVQLTYNMNSVTAQVLCWPLPLTDVQPLPNPLWQERLREAQSVFSQDWGLEGHAMTRTSGIDNSPLGDFSAVNNSLHPSDGCEYTIDSDRMSSIQVLPTRTGGDGGFLLHSGRVFQARDVSAEAYLFSLQRYLERVPDATHVDDTFQDSLLQIFDLASVAERPNDYTPITQDTPAQVIARQVRENMLFLKRPLTSRIKLLSSFRTGQIPKKVAPDADVVRAIVSETARMPRFLKEADGLSQTISRIHDLILAKLTARDGQADDSDKWNDQDPEKCGICESDMAFESLCWARCPNNHIFTRCALSFVSIQTPGTAKFCGICNTQYLNENLIFDIQPPTPDRDVSSTDLPPEKDGNQWVMVKQGSSATEPVMSLARILFSAINRCVCCGGRFVG